VVDGSLEVRQNSNPVVSKASSRQGRRGGLLGRTDGKGGQRRHDVADGKKGHDEEEATLTRQR
jgi:hypothetical protein